MTVHRWLDLLQGLFTSPIASAFWMTLGMATSLRLTILRGLNWPRVFVNGWMCGATGGGAAALIGHAWIFAVASAISLAVALAIRWWRKHRDRVKALTGAKSRALRDALAARMPRPAVLRPVRGGAS